MSLTDRRVVPYLTYFTIAGSRVGGVELSYPMFHDIHFSSKSYTIYILTPEIPELPSLIIPTMASSDRCAILYLTNFATSVVADSWVPGLTKVSTPISHSFFPATITLFPMHIYYALNANNLSCRFVKIIINKRRA
jgi:hypothetical protein